ncbi:hypothetical protein HJD18_13760 [Thermoleophilia bacterium SCSIO 60948]|nr:hypothetical protein HJD18_13760 [Thermoleophilia bacterium SCSIO 60948]
MEGLAAPTAEGDVAPGETALEVGLEPSEVDAFERPDELAVLGTRLAVAQERLVAVLR